MLNARDEARRQVEYIDAELARGQHDYAGRAAMLQERRAAIIAKMGKG